MSAKTGIRLRWPGPFSAAALTFKGYEMGPHITVQVIFYENVRPIVNFPGLGGVI